MLDGVIRLPQFCDFLAQDRAPQEEDARLPLLLIGSPLYQDAREPAFSMTDGYFPSDGHLRGLSGGIGFLDLIPAKAHRSGCRWIGLILASRG
jgi:hypothetical protein